jgi:hypothetical protein
VGGLVLRAVQLVVRVHEDDPAAAGECAADGDFAICHRLLCGRQRLAHQTFQHLLREVHFTG